MRPSVTIVMRSVCPLVTHLSCAKMAELIEMPFRIWTFEGPKNHGYPMGRGSCGCSCMNLPVVSILNVIRCGQERCALGALATSLLWQLVITLYLLTRYKHRRRLCHMPCSV